MMAPAVHPFLDWPGPIAFAHRGGALDCAENTMGAFERAVALGYRYLETDAHVTRDGVVMAFHDPLLDRVTDRRGAISDLPVAEVEAADAAWGFTMDGGRTFPQRGEGVRIPRMSELLERWPDVRVNIDTKSDAVVAPLAELLQRMGVLDRVCVGSFSDARLQRLRELCSGRVCTSMGPRAITVARLVAYARLPMPRLGADCVQVPPRQHGLTVVTRAMVAAAHRGGLQVHVWTIDDATEMERLLDLGVDGIMTDRPALLRDVLRRRRAWVDMPALVQ